MLTPEIPNYGPLPVVEADELPEAIRRAVALAAESGDQNLLDAVVRLVLAIGARDSRRRDRIILKNAETIGTES